MTENEANENAIQRLKEQLHDVKRHRDELNRQLSANAAYQIRLQTRAEQAEARLLSAKEYVTRLACNLHAQHYQVSAPHWQPFDDLEGVLTQLDNMLAGLERKK